MARKIGSKVQLSEEAIENYGEFYRGRELTITHVSTKYMPAKEFYAKNMPNGYHPGYDESANGMPLYDFDEIEFSLYEWEINNI